VIKTTETQSRTAHDSSALDHAELHDDNWNRNVKDAMAEFEEWTDLFSGKVFVKLVICADESGTHDEEGIQPGASVPVIGGYKPTMTNTLRSEIKELAGKYESVKRALNEIPNNDFGFLRRNYEGAFPFSRVSNISRLKILVLLFNGRRP
jgi:hypothetical protein